jgi:hypothetical protein
VGNELALSFRETIKIRPVKHNPNQKIRGIFGANALKLFPKGGKIRLPRPIKIFIKPVAIPA